jgi:hypothetical protein
MVLLQPLMKLFMQMETPSSMESRYLPYPTQKVILYMNISQRLLGDEMQTVELTIDGITVNVNPNIVKKRSFLMALGKVYTSLESKDNPFEAILSPVPEMLFGDKLSEVELHLGEGEEPDIDTLYEFIGKVVEGLNAKNSHYSQS